MSLSPMAHQLGGTTSLVPASASTTYRCGGQTESSVTSSSMVGALGFASSLNSANLHPDHLFANFRQKHGLYGMAPIEPVGARYLEPHNLKKEIITGIQAVILTPERPSDQLIDIVNRDNGLFPDNSYTNPRDIFNESQETVEADSLNVYPGTFREWVNFVGDFHVSK
jgi:hypothetical protein